MSQSHLLQENDTRNLVQIKNHLAVTHHLSVAAEINNFGASMYESLEMGMANGSMASVLEGAVMSSSRKKRHRLSQNFQEPSLLHHPPTFSGRPSEQTTRTFGEEEDIIDFYKQAVESVVVAVEIAAQKGLDSTRKSNFNQYIVSIRDRVLQLTSGTTLGTSEKDSFQCPLLYASSAVAGAQDYHDNEDTTTAACLSDTESRLQFARAAVRIEVPNGSVIEQTELKKCTSRSISAILYNMSLVLLHLAEEHHVLVGDEKGKWKRTWQSSALGLLQLSCQTGSFCLAETTTESFDDDKYARVRTTLLAALNNVGCILDSFGKEVEATRHLAEALRLSGDEIAARYQNPPPNESNDQYNNHLSKGMAMFQSTCASLLYNVGIVHRDRGEHGLALHNLWMSLQFLAPERHIAAFDGDDGHSSSGPCRNARAITLTLTEIAGIECRCSRHEQALYTYNLCLRVQRHCCVGRRGGDVGGDDRMKTSPESHESRMMAETLFRIGKIHHECTRYASAMACYRESFSLMQSADPSAAGVVVDGGVILCCIAQVHHVTGDAEEALNCYERVLEIFRAGMGECNPTVVWILNVIGNLHLQLGRVRTALVFLAEEASIRSKLSCPSQSSSSSSILADDRRNNEGEEEVSSGSLWRSVSSSSDILPFPLQYSLALAHPPSAAAA